MKAVYYIIISIFLVSCDLDDNPDKNMHASSTIHFVDSINEVPLKFKVKQPDRFQLSFQALGKSEEIAYDEGRYGAYLDIGAIHCISNQYDSAIIYLFNAKSYFPDGSINEGLANFFLGETYSDLQNFDKANDFFLQAMEVFKERNDEKHLAMALTSLGIICARQSRFVDALAFFKEAYEIGIKIDYTNDRILNCISIAYRNLGDNGKALEFAHKALQQSDDFSKYSKLHTIGNIFFKAKGYDSAIYYYLQSYEHALERNQYVSAYSSMKSVGNVHLEMGEVEKSLNVYRKTLKFLADQPVNNYANHLYLKLAEAHQSLGNLDSALHYSNLTWQTALESRSIKDIYYGAEQMKKVHKDMGDPILALKYGDLAMLYKDSLEQKNEQKKFADLRVEIETKALENSMYEKEDQIARVRWNLLKAIITLALIALLITFFSIFIFRWLKNRQKHLKDEIVKRKGELYQQNLHVMQMNKQYSEIEKDLKEIDIPETKKEIDKILKKITLGKVLESEWETFNTYFGSIHQDFYKKLSRYSNGLTQHEKRICALIRTNLTSREIASILHIEVKSVSMCRYRIKKKLDLTEQRDLSEFLTGL